MTPVGAPFFIMEENILIDLDNLLEQKFGDKVRHFPRFVRHYLKRILHIDSLNEIIQKSNGLTGWRFAQFTLQYLNIDIVVEGAENLPEHNNLIFVSNHPLGGPDGLALASFLGNRYNDNIILPVNDFLMFVKPFGPLFLPINKVGAQSRNLPDRINSVMETDSNIILFPAGICSRKIDGEIKDLPWTKMFVRKSVEYGRDIVPIYFFGKNSPRFYFLDRLQKFLGIKFSIPMVFLVDEMFRHRNKQFKFIIGNPISYTIFDRTKTPAQWASHIRNMVYELKRKYSDGDK